MVIKKVSTKVIYLLQLYKKNGLTLFNFFISFFSYLVRTSTEHKTASLADEGNSAYCQSSGAHNIKHI